MEIIRVEGEYNIASMGFLLSMKACAAKVAPEHNKDLAKLEELTAEKTQLTAQLHQTSANNPDQSQILMDINGRLTQLEARLGVLRRNMTNNAQAVGRVEANFLPNLVGAPILEVNDVPSAEFVMYLVNTCGWRGTACYDENIDLDLQNKIRIALGLVPYRVKRTMENGQIILVPPPSPPAQAQHP